MGATPADRTDWGIASTTTSDCHLTRNLRRITSFGVLTGRVPFLRQKADPKPQWATLRKSPTLLSTVSESTSLSSIALARLQGTRFSLGFQSGSSKTSDAPKLALAACSFTELRTSPGQRVRRRLSRRVADRYQVVVEHVGSLDLADGLNRDPGARHQSPPISCAGEDRLMFLRHRAPFVTMAGVVCHHVGKHDD